MPFLVQWPLEFPDQAWAEKQSPLPVIYGEMTMMGKNHNGKKKMNIQFCPLHKVCEKKKYHLSLTDFHLKDKKNFFSLKFLLH